MKKRITGSLVALLLPLCAFAQEGMRAPSLMQADYELGQYVHAAREGVQCVATTEVACAEENAAAYTLLPPFYGARASAIAIEDGGSQPLIGTAAGEVFRYDGRAWVALGQPRSGAIRALAGLPDGSAVVAYAEAGPPDTAMIYVRSGDAWAAIPDLGNAFDTLSMPGPGQVNAHGEQGELVWQNGATAWQAVPAGGTEKDTSRHGSGTIRCTLSITLNRADFSAGGGSGAVTVHACFSTQAWTLSASGATLSRNTATDPLALPLQWLRI